MGIETRRMIAAGSGLGGPVAWGVASGHPALGTLAALGALSVSGVSMGAAPVDGVVAKGASLAEGLARGGYAVAVTTVAGLVGAAVGGHGWITAVTIVLVAALAAVVGGISRPMAEHTTRFIVFMVITTGLAEHAAPVAAAVLFAEGAIWGLLVTALCTHTKQPGTKRSRPKRPRRTEPAAVPPANPAPTKRALLRRWWRTLKTMRGRQYPIRLTACLAVAEIIGLMWPQPTASWIAVTLVIVVRRQLDGALRRAIERAAGTGAGVVAGSAVLLWVPAPWLFVLLVTGLAAVRPVLKDRDYTLYATVMTPLVLLLMEGGGRVAPATIGYRLADTAIGCVLALGLGYLPWAVRRERSTRAIVD
ncbi:MAG TPA: FUSC family protein [Nonomuraea sp.]|nr:FUSC family protein [Nonomuraea sp.]